MPSLWQRHELNFYKYGHIYSTIFGQPAIDYVPQKPVPRRIKQLFIAYSHVLALLLIVVLPCYFGYNFQELMSTLDIRMQLLLYVNFTNTLIKYTTVIVSYIANNVHFKAINNGCTLQRQRLEVSFAAGYQGSDGARRQFERFMYIKFCLINLMMAIQVCAICAYRSDEQLRMQFAVYGFILWNYTENTADYFFFISCSVSKYLRQLNVQLLGLWRQSRRPQRSCQLEQQLMRLHLRFGKINDLYVKCFEMHQFQLLGIVLTTLINNLTNLFTLFNMLAKQSLEDVTYPVVLSTLYALGFYIDTYIVTLVNEHIKTGLLRLARTIRKFSERTNLDCNINQQIEQLSMQLLLCREPYLVCGLLQLDRRLVYLISVTAISYFITLVQFDMYLRKVL